MLTGTLDDFTLPDVLRLIATARRTGGLTVTRDGGAGNLYFRDGTVSRGVARYERRTEPATPGSAVEDLTFDLMRWDRGEFTWSSDASSPSGPEAAIDVEDLLREVSRRLEELAQIHSLVPSEEAVLTMAPQPPEGAVQINITPAEWRVLVLVDGHRTVSEIAGAAHLDDLDAMKLLYGLAAAGLVTAGAGSAPAPMAEAAVVPSQELSDMSDMTDTPGEETHAAPESEPRAPEPDPFLAELDVEPLAPFDEAPLNGHAVHEAPAVDRSTAARELAGLFDEGDPMSTLGGMAMVAPPAPPPGGGAIRRVEDDDQVTRGLISRLIDGVKGL